jgi:hypothetical protein
MHKIDSYADAESVCGGEIITIDKSVYSALRIALILKLLSAGSRKLRLRTGTYAPGPRPCDEIA